MRGLLFCEFETFLSDHKIYVFIINTVWHFLSSFLSIFTFVIRSILCNKIILLRMKIIIRVKDEKSKAWVCHAYKEDTIDFEILVNPWPILHPHYYSSWTMDMMDDDDILAGSWSSYADSVGKTRWGCADFRPPNGEMTRCHSLTDI